MRRQTGFTMIELLVVMGMLTIIAGMSMPFFQSFQASTDATTYATTFQHMARRAQQQAFARLESSSWGIFFDDAHKKYVLFKGSSYAGRDTSYDDERTYPPAFTMTTSFGNELIFSAGTGATSASGTVQIVDPNGVTRTVTIGTNGLVQ